MRLAEQALAERERRLRTALRFDTALSATAAANAASIPPVPGALGCSTHPLLEAV